MTKITNTLKREPLAEGIVEGIAFGFLRRVGEFFELVTPISTCKDYLNDVIWCERNNKPYSIYGLNYAPLGNVLDQPTAFIVARVLNSKYATPNDLSLTATQAALQNRLLNNIHNIQGLLNTIEEHLKIKNRTIIRKLDNNCLLFEFDSETWGGTTCGISLYTSLIRVATNYLGGSIFEYLDKISNFKDQPEWDRWPIISGKLKYFLKHNELPRKELTIGQVKIHGYGVLNWTMPQEYLSVKQGWPK